MLFSVLTRFRRSPKKLWCPALCGENSGSLSAYLLWDTTRREWIFCLSSTVKSLPLQHTDAYLPQYPCSTAINPSRSTGSARVPKSWRPIRGHSILLLQAKREPSPPLLQDHTMAADRVPGRLPPLPAMEIRKSSVLSANPEEFLLPLASHLSILRLLKPCFVNSLILKPMLAHATRSKSSNLLKSFPCLLLPNQNSYQSLPRVSKLTMLTLR